MSSTQNDTMCEQFKARLNTAAGQYSYRELGRLTGVHPETIRRYMQGHAPSAVFLSRLCESLGISGEWLLTGHGPMKSTDICMAALRRAGVKELLQALSATITNQDDRINQLTLAVQQLQKNTGVARGNDAMCDQTRPKARKLSMYPEPKGTPAVDGSELRAENGSEANPAA